MLTGGLLAGWPLLQGGGHICCGDAASVHLQPHRHCLVVCLILGLRGLYAGCCAVSLCEEASCLGLRLVWQAARLRPDTTCAEDQMADSACCLLSQ